MSDWGTVSFICDLSAAPAVISALSSSGGAENAHMFPFSLSYLTCLQGLESDVTTTGAGGCSKSGGRRSLATVSACYLF